MKLKFRKKNNILFCFITLVSVVFLIIYLSSNQNNIFEYNQYSLMNKYELSSIGFKFNPNKHVLVFLHIQKTGGSDFDRNLVKHLLVRKKNQWKRACEFTLNKTFIKSKQFEIIDEDHKNKKIHFNQEFLNKTRLKKLKFKKFACKRDKFIEGQDSNFYFSRQTFGWVCGLHADYSELNDCLKKFYPGLSKNNFYFFTILRSPVLRFLRYIYL